MTTLAAASVMTMEELLALPRNGVERWLIRGQLREKPMTVRHGLHGRIMARSTCLLERWLELRPEPRGSILCGEAYCRLRCDPDTTVGLDVAYIAPGLVARQTDQMTLVDGVPVLAVMILSPKDTVGENGEKVNSLLAAGVALVWVVNPHNRTVLIYQPDDGPRLVNVTQELSGEPHLPGFRVAVARLFE